jgi:hypothetical protein
MLNTILTAGARRRGRLARNHCEARPLQMAQPPRAGSPSISPSEDAHDGLWIKKGARFRRRANVSEKQRGISGTSRHLIHTRDS